MQGESKQTVVVADYDYGDVDIERKIVEDAGYKLVPAQCKSEEDVINVARDADAVLSEYAPISAKVIDSFSRCQVIARYGTGVDIVDVDAATRRNIQVTNVPNEWCVNEVADHAMALLLTFARKIMDYNRATRSGVWAWQSGEPIHRLKGSTLGMISFGSIGQAIANRASAFGLIILASDPFKPEEEIIAAGARPVTFDYLIEHSDFVVVQAPLTNGTRHLINEDALRRMKPNAVLINTARGPIVSDTALNRALKEGWISGAGVDDLEEEPAKIRDWKPRNPLFERENLIISPHAAYYSIESIGMVRDFAAHEVIRVLSGNPPLSPVNIINTGID